jgi:hypothetical protein
VGRFAAAVRYRHHPDAPEVKRTVLVRVVAPHFVAGLVMDGDRCVEAAPILAWCVGKDAPELRAYFFRRDWKATITSVRR